MLDAFPFLRDLAVILISAAVLGWGATRLGLPAVVGYLLAGVLIGTPEIAIVDLQDSDRMQLLSQLGLVFLMFSIGLDLRIERLRALGWPIVVAGAITASLVLVIVQGFGSLMGLNSTQAFFFAGMFVSSSSAIISKALETSPQRHERHGQLALACTLLEDIAAVMILTILSTRDGPDTSGLVQILGTLGAVTMFLLVAGIVGLVLLPRILTKVLAGPARELETLAVAGLLFALSSLAMFLGFSLALGAFLFGMVVAETDRRAHLERIFRGMRDVFLAVFFVATGMLLDWREIGDAWGLIVLGTLLALIVRPLAATCALVLGGEEGRTAFRAGLGLVAIGEFAIVIAGMGSALGLLDGSFSVTAVALTVATGGLAPLIIERSAAISGFAERIVPARIERLSTAYRAFWTNLGERSQRSFLWRLLRKRLIQIAVELVLILVLLTAGQPIARWATGAVAGSDGVIRFGTWILIGVACLPLIIALVRNLDAIILILTDAWVQSSRLPARVIMPLGVIVRTFAYLGLALWIGSFLSVNAFGGWGLLILLLILLVVGWTAWRRLNRWHSEWESELQQVLSGERNLPASLAESTSAWGLRLGEVELSEESAAAGRSLGRIALRATAGVTLVAIERQGMLIAGPDAGTALYPGDRILLLGDDEEVEKGRRELSRPSQREHREQSVRDALTRSWRAVEGSPVIGKRLADLAWPRRFGVLVAAVRRRHTVTRNPGANTRFEVGDELLLVGSPSNLHAWARGLEEAEDGKDPEAETSPGKPLFGA